MTLTEDQRTAVAAGQNVPLNVDRIECILWHADVYEKVRTLLSDGWTHEELDAMLALSADGSDWMDPAMDIDDK